MEIKEEIPNPVKGSISLQKHEVLIIHTHSGRLKVVFGYIPALIHLIKSIPYHRWDSKNKWWTIPYSEQFLQEVKRKIVELNLRLNYKEEEKNGKIQKARPGSIHNYKSCPKEYRNKLEEKRSSPSTIRAYTPFLKNSSIIFLTLK